MNIRIKTTRDPDGWPFARRMVRIQVPSKWPKGQSVWDRLYWLDLATQQVEPFTPEARALNALYTIACAFACREN